MLAKILKSALVLQIVFLCFCSCDDDEVSPSPIIESVTPGSAGPGNTILIKGQNFRQSASENIVMFGDKRAVVAVASSTELMVKVPENFVSGKISIQIGDQKVIFDREFSTYPIIQNFLPKSGAVGDTIRIEGRSFSEELNANKIIFGEQQANVVKLTKGFETSFLYVTLPEGATTGIIDAVIGNKQAVSIDTFKVLKFEITLVDPNEGFPGQTVIISGSAFNPQFDKNKVYFNEAEAQVDYGDETSLSVTIPDGASTGKIKVMTKGRSAESVDDFIVTERPVATINSFSPERGVPGTQVYIYGVGFSSVAEENQVKIGNINASVIYATLTELIFVVPENSTTGLLSVSSYGNTALSSSEFTVFDPSTLLIENFTPESGIVGSEVIINGFGFNAEPSLNAVFFNGTQAAINYSSETQISVIVPEGATTGLITVEVNGNSITSEFEFMILEQSPLSIQGFTPESGTIGSEVFLSGSGFSFDPSLNTVYFNGIQAEVTLANESFMIVIVPDGATTGKITVEVNGNSITTEADFVIDE